LIRHGSLHKFSLITNTQRGAHYRLDKIAANVTKTSQWEIVWFVKEQSALLVACNQAKLTAGKNNPPDSAANTSPKECTGREN